MSGVAKIVVADDHPLVRAGVVAALQERDFCRVVGEAADALQSLQLVERCKPDLLILDLELGCEFPAETLIPGCRERHPELKVLILSGHTETRHVLPLRDLGVDGFVVKSEAPDCLTQAVRLVLDGEKWFSHAVAAAISARSAQPDLLDRLTPRELQVLRLMHEGRDNEAIAQVLGLSKQTIRRYATIIYEKLGVKNRIEAILALEARDWQVLA
ncbi:MAG: response regulator transcription factor [Candidatus Eremiobacteraeota bacterium]|nr:response regulator transcription factor [Candidatus Eremiobacteraeota bacterium]